MSCNVCAHHRQIFRGMAPSLLAHFSLDDPSWVEVPKLLRFIARTHQQPSPHKPCTAAFFASEPPSRGTLPREVDWDASQPPSPTPAAPQTPPRAQKRSAATALGDSGVVAPSTLQPVALTVRPSNDATAATLCADPMPPFKRARLDAADAVRDSALPSTPPAAARRLARPENDEDCLTGLERDKDGRIKLTKKTAAADVVRITALPKTWDIPEVETAYIVDLSGDTRTWVSKKGNPMSMAAIIKSEVRLPAKRCAMTHNTRIKTPGRSSRAARPRIPSLCCRSAKSSVSALFPGATARLYVQTSMRPIWPTTRGRHAISRRTATSGRRSVIKI